MQNNSIPQFLIGAPNSNSGKTTVTLGLLRAFKNRGLTTQPYKCGPDYLDVMHHTNAAGRQSLNLDLFMGSEQHVRTTYGENITNCHVTLTEGVMGLFDGAKKMEGSSAQVALLLNLPVIIVVDARSTAYSVAPLLHGFKTYHPQLNLAGVIFNFVASPSHYEFLKEAANDARVPSLGYLPRTKDLQIPSRHLGLSVSGDVNYDPIIEKTAQLIEQYINIDQLLKITTQPKPQYPTPTLTTAKKKIKIAVAKDEAFNFIYSQNIKALNTIGEICYFSPINDAQLPEADLIYLAGGYPELHLPALSANTSMLDSIKSYVEKGGRLYAECGGMMYLCNNIVDKNSKAFPMANIFNQDASMKEMKLTLGYRKAIINNLEYRGHEFHYSQTNNTHSKEQPAHILSARDREIPTKIWRNNNCLGSYIHFYWETPQQLSTFLKTTHLTP